MTTTANHSPASNLGEALGRIHKAVHSTYRITTDGRDHYPDSELEDLAAGLGYHRDTRTEPFNPYGSFVANADRADRRKAYRMKVALRVLERAGADQADMDTLRAAIGVEREDSTFIDQLDARNTQARQYWLEEFQRLQAVAVENARADERSKVLAELQMSEAA